MRMEVWEVAWLNCQPMPAQGFSRELLAAAQDAAEEWLFDARFRCILEEWVSRQEADEVMGGLLWSGFCLRGQPQKRVAPIPVLVRLLYVTPPPADATETRQQMRTFFARAVREWCQAFQQHQQSLRVAP
jgi:hypothetical protein